MLRTALCALMAGASMCLTTVGSAQQIDTGVLMLRIVDFNTQRPLAGVRVSFPDLSLSTESDLTGYAYLTEIPLGNHHLDVELGGYASVQAILDFEPDELWAEGEVVLVPELEGVEVIGTSRVRSLRLLEKGFYQRERQGFGRFFTREDAVLQQAFFLSDVLRRVPGIRVGPSGITTGTGFNGFQGEQSRRSYRSCTPAIFLDDAEWKGRLDDLPVSWIEGMEVYNRGSLAPARYNVFGGCGVLVIWTR